ncbi:MAG TPA: hypothetical protein VGC45_09310 [Gryllotalpicola sp.]
MRIGTKTSVLGVASLITAVGLACAMAVPANADPIHPNPTTEANETALVGVGSDTIQDLFTGLTQTVLDQSSSNPVFSSYDAVGSAQIKTRVLGQQFDRPNGSGPGLTALRSAVEGGTRTTPNNGANVVLRGSDVQFSRSSSFTTPTVAGGRYAQIPIAVDAVTYATSTRTAGATQTKIPTGIPVGGTPDAATGTTGNPDDITLSNIFAGKGYLSSSVGGTTYKFYSGDLAQSAVASGYTKLDVYVPQSGSGTRNFWYQALGLGTNTVLAPGVQDHFNGAVNEEHDGTAVGNDPVGIEPFSIAQFNAQSNIAEINGDYGTSVVDRRHGVVLNAVADGSNTVVQPTTGAGVLNTAFPISRPVFVNVEYAQLKINPYLEGAFVDDSNFAVSNSIYDAVNPADFTTSVINDFGFAKIPAAGFTTPVYPGVTFRQGDANDYRFN